MMDGTVIHQNDVGRTVRESLIIQFQAGNATTNLSLPKISCTWWVLDRGDGSCNDALAMLALLKSIIWALFRQVAARSSAEADNVALRQHVTALQRQLGHRPKLTRWDRLLFAALYHVQPDVLRSISIVRPETVVRWHRMGFACSGDTNPAANLDGRVFRYHPPNRIPCFGFKFPCSSKIIPCFVA